MVGKLKGIVRKPARPVSVDDMNKAVQDAAVSAYDDSVRSIDQLRSGNHRDDRAPESSWNYRVMEFSEGEERWQAIHEVHYREGVPASYSEQPASVQWDAEDRNDTGHGNLDRMRDSLNKPVLRPEDFA